MPIYRYNKTSTTSKNSNNNKTKYERNTIHTLKGGKYIDKGGFGCIVSPALKCYKSDTGLKQYISKIIHNSLSPIDNELIISKILKKIDPEQKFYLTYNKHCYINNIQTERDDIINVLYNNDLTKFNIVEGQKQKDTNACKPQERKK